VVAKVSAVKKLFTSVLCACRMEGEARVVFLANRINLDLQLRPPFPSSLAQNSRLVLGTSLEILSRAWQEACLENDSKTQPP
jgi:hypothetical protein